MIELPGSVRRSKVEDGTNPEQNIITLRGSSDEAGWTITIQGRMSRHVVAQIKEGKRYRIFLKEI